MESRLTWTAPVKWIPPTRIIVKSQLTLFGSVSREADRMATATLDDLGTMDFAHRLVEARQQAGLTQPALADRIGTCVAQILRYEARTSTPTLDVFRDIAIGRSVTIDGLVFDDHERGPQDELRLAFEAIEHLDPEEQAVVRELIEAMLLKHEARRWAS